MGGGYTELIKNFIYFYCSKHGFSMLLEVFRNTFKKAYSKGTKFDSFKFRGITELKL